MTAPRRRRSPFARVLAVIGALLVSALGLTVVAIAEQPASAVSAAQMLKSFDPSDIISDQVMFNSGTMTAAQIQAFLVSRVPTCRTGYTCLKDYSQDTVSKAGDPMCGPYTGAKNESAATIIYKVGKACGVNPQVLLVTLQKEQALVTDDWPNARQYRSATGYGCPDTAPCDSDYYGFFNQVYRAAWAFRRYTTPPGTEGAGWTKYNWFPVGRPSGVLYHPNAACGAATITIKNKATAVLYYFTPYQPNTAALAAGFGIGNSCSAYGNRNFFLYFTSWFGSTHYVVTGATATYWRAQGGAKGALGNPLQNATTLTAAGGGTVQQFQGGTVYSSPAGTVTVKGVMLSEYLSQAGPSGDLGWPRKDVVSRSDNGGGTIQAFAGGSIYASGAGAFAVTGDRYARYAKASFQAGSLGWPTGEEITAVNGSGSQQAFSGGRIVVTPTASTIVSGALLAKWVQRGGDSSSLGWPAAEAASVTAGGRTGTVQLFTGGTVVQLGKSVYTVTGDIGRNWRSHAGPTGSLGWPTGPAQSSTANGGGWSQRFAGGAVLWSAASGVHALTGQELALYDARGGTAGSLGWPGTRTYVTTEGLKGHVTVFTNGRIYSSKAGTIAVLGDILTRYVAKDGPAGSLGWPTTSARREKGLLTQHFQFGLITWTADGGAKASRT